MGRRERTPWNDIVLSNYSTKKVKLESLLHNNSKFRKYATYDFWMSISIKLIKERHI